MHYSRHRWNPSHSIALAVWNVWCRCSKRLSWVYRIAAEEQSHRWVEIVAMPQNCLHIRPIPPSQSIPFDYNLMPNSSHSSACEPTSWLHRLQPLLKTKNKMKNKRNSIEWEGYNTNLREMVNVCQI